MIHTRFIKTIYTIALVFSISLCAKAQESKPNIVLIMADDVSWEAFGSYGSKEYQTPNIDKLAKKGIRFEHCYSTPICTPSRVMIMTGKYNFRNYTHFGYLNPKEKTFGNLLQEAGYKTAIAGKWQLSGYHNKLPGYQDNTRAYKAGFDEYCLWQLSKSKKAGERFWNPPLEQNGKFTTSKENRGKYGPDLFCNFICDFMERKEQEKQPFFVYYPMVLVHAPFLPTPTSIGDKSPTKEVIKSFKDKKTNFKAMVNYMDEIVGRIVSKTEKLGIADNTVIIFTSDNGTHSSITSTWNGMQIKGGKGKLKDMGTHVPLIAYQKNNFKGDRVISTPVDFTDIYPTLADLSGIDLGKKDPIDGISLLPKLLDTKGETREVAVCHYQPYWNKIPGQFVRTGEYKLYSDGRFYTPSTDLEENNNLSEALRTKKDMKAYKTLQKVIAKMPPAPVEKKDKYAKERPTYPQWKKIMP